MFLYFSQFVPRWIPVIRGSCDTYGRSQMRRPLESNPVRNCMEIHGFHWDYIESWVFPSKFNQKYQPEKGDLSWFTQRKNENPINIYHDLPMIYKGDLSWFAIFFFGAKFHGDSQIFGTGTLFQSPARTPAVPVLRRETVEMMGGWGIVYV